MTMSYYRKPATVFLRKMAEGSGVQRPPTRAEQIIQKRDAIDPHATGMRVAVPSGIGGSLLGAGLGTGAGLLGTYAFGEEDEKKRKKYFENALMGGLVGGVGGGGLGAGGGYLAGKGGAEYYKALLTAAAATSAAADIAEAAGQRLPSKPLPSPMPGE